MGRPRCVSYNVVSVDGRVTTAPGVLLLAGDARWSAAARDVADPYAWPRETHDPEVFLEGSGSFVGDDAGPVAAGEPAGPQQPFLPPQVVDVPGRRWLAVVDGRGRVDLQLTEWPDPAWAGWHTLVVTSEAAPAAYLERLRDRGIPYVVAGRGPVDLPEALQLLGELLGIRTVVASGGGRLNGALLRAGLVDEVDLELLPVAIGGRGTPALFDAPPLRPDEWPVELDLVSVEHVDGGRLRLRYLVTGTLSADET